MRDPQVPPSFLLVALSALLLFPAGCKQVGGAADQPAPMDPLRDQLLSTSGITEEDEAMLRRADRCARYDRFWIEGMQRDEQTETIYEFLGPSMACWRRVGQSTLSNAPAQKWIASWTGYVAVQRHYVWAQLAVEGNNRFDTCHRYDLSSEALVEAEAAAEGLVEGMTSAGARAMAIATAEALTSISANLDRDRRRQRCESQP